jgi:hypothetical protein
MEIAKVNPIHAPILLELPSPPLVDAATFIWLLSPHKPQVLGQKSLYLNGIEFFVVHPRGRPTAHILGIYKRDAGDALVRNEGSIILALVSDGKGVAFQ